MQQRSLSTLYARSFLTLGFYSCIWLLQTGEELTRLTGLRMAKAGWLVALATFQTLGIILAFVLTASIIANNSPGISNDCWTEYVTATAPETMQRTALSEDCRAAVQAYDTAINRQDAAIKVYLVVIALLVLSRIGLPRWLRNYGLAVQTLTGGRLSQTYVMLLCTVPLAGMLAMQSEFNNMPYVKLSSPRGTVVPALASRQNKNVRNMVVVLICILLACFAYRILITLLDW